MDLDAQAADLRRQMVAQIRHLGVRDDRVLQAMMRIPRHRFIPEGMAGLAASYGDHPCPIGHGQSISQPYIVAYMIERLHIRPGRKVLEIGAGSGYQAAVLAELGAAVYTLEVVPQLADHATRALAECGYSNVQVRLASGFQGWPEESPFDAILGACCPTELPSILTGQLAEGGRMILPIGDLRQHLELITKHHGACTRQLDLPVRFVPMV